MARAKSSRAVVQTGIASLEVHEFGVPEIGPDEGLLRMELCGICGSDVEQYDGRFDELGWTVGPTIPGHEPLGIIEQVGERAAKRWGVEPGDRVAVEPLIPCGECEACREGQRTRCSGWGRMYSYGLLDTDVEPRILGGYSEYMYLHPNTVLHKMPLSMPVCTSGSSPICVPIAGPYSPHVPRTVRSSIGAQLNATFGLEVPPTSLYWS